MRYTGQTEEWQLSSTLYGSSEQSMSKHSKVYQGERGPEGIPCDRNTEWVGYKYPMIVPIMFIYKTKGGSRSSWEDNRWSLSRFKPGAQRAFETSLDFPPGIQLLLQDIIRLIPDGFASPTKMQQVFQGISNSAKDSSLGKRKEALGK